MWAKATQLLVFFHRTPPPKFFFIFQDQILDAWHLVAKAGRRMGTTATSGALPRRTGLMLRRSARRRAATWPLLFIRRAIRIGFSIRNGFG